MFSLVLSALFVDYLHSSGFWVEIIVDIDQENWKQINSQINQFFARSYLLNCAKTALVLAWFITPFGWCIKILNTADFTWAFNDVIWTVRWNNWTSLLDKRSLLLSGTQFERASNIYELSGKITCFWITSISNNIVYNCNSKIRRKRFSWDVGSSTFAHSPHFNARRPNGRSFSFALNNTWSFV